MTRVYNKSSYLEKRRTLRKNLPPAEKIIWRRLKRKQLAGYKFRRQYGIGKYIVDFYCPSVKLAIEIDGKSHDMDVVVRRYDRERQRFIESFGVFVLRFNNLEIYRNLEGVLQEIEIKCQELSHS